MTEEHRMRCLAAGMHDFLTKPVRRDHLEAILFQYAFANRETLDSSATRQASKLVTTDIKHVVLPDSFPGLQHFTSVSGQPEELFATMVEAFLIEAPEALQALYSAIEAQDFRAIRRNAHTIKSCLKYLTDGEDVEIAAKIEATAKRNQPVDRQQLDALQQCVHHWCDLLKDFGGGMTR